MHRRLISLFAAVSMLGATGAWAGSLTDTEWLQQVNTAGVVVNTVIPSTPISGAYIDSLGFGAANYSVASETLVSVTTTGAVPLGVKVKLNGGQQIVNWVASNVNIPSATPNDAGGIPGFARINLLTLNGPTLANIPLSVGPHNTATSTATFGGGTPNSTSGLYVQVMLTTSGWTNKKVTVSGLTASPLLSCSPGGVCPPTPNGTFVPGTGSRMFTGGFEITPNDGLIVTLVAPTKVTVNSNQADGDSTTASNNTLTLTYLPEPGTLLLLGAGAAGLALVARRKK